MDGEISQETGGPRGFSGREKPRPHRLRYRRVAEYLGTPGLQTRGGARIPCFKIGGCIRFDPMAVAVWLRQKMAPASASLQPAPEDRLLVMEGRTPRRR